LRNKRNKVTTTTITITLLLIMTAIIGYSGFAAADDSNPGSASDPLVTKSYVEKYVQTFVQSFVPDYIEKMGALDKGASLEWNIAELAEGQEFIGKAGTEFIVRSGAAVVVDPSGSGIPDLTAGKNVLAGQTAELNHLFSVPREDGRGIRAQKQTIIMYRGF